MTMVGRLKRLYKGIGETLLIVMITIVLLEAVLWGLAAANTKIAYMTATGRDTTIADAALKFRLDPHYPGHDRDGYRNAEVLAQAEVVALGDSMTYGLMVQPDKAWPQQLATLTGRSVYNMGVGGYGPVQYMQLTPKALEKHPRWVVSALFEGNDLLDAYGLAHWSAQYNDLLTRDQALVAAVAKAQAEDDINARANRLAGMNFEEFQSYVDDSLTRPDWKSRLTDEFKKHCKLWNLGRNVRLLAMQSGRESQRGLLSGIIWRHLAGKASQSQGLWVAYDRDGIKTIFMPSYRSMALQLDDPRVEEGLQITEESFRRSAKMARAAHTDFAILMIPNKELVFYEAFADTHDSAIDKLAGVAKLEMAFRARFKHDLCEQGYQCIDVLPALCEALKAGQDPYPMNQDVHPNPLGQAIYANAVNLAIDAGHAAVVAR